MFIPASTQNPLQTHGCCVRFDDVSTNTPRIHANTAHICVGVDEIYVTPEGYLRFELTKRLDGGTYPIVTMGAWPDERTDRLGWQMGFSGGNGHANMMMGLNGAFVRADDPRLFGANRNIWVMFVTLGDAVK